MAPIKDRGQLIAVWCRQLINAVAAQRDIRGTIPTIVLHPDDLFELQAYIESRRTVTPGTHTLLTARDVQPPHHLYGRDLVGWAGFPRVCRQQVVIPQSIVERWKMIANCIENGDISEAQDLAIDGMVELASHSKRWNEKI